MSLYFQESFRDGPRDRTLALFAMKIRKETPNVKTNDLESISTPLCSHDLREFAPLCRPERERVQRLVQLFKRLQMALLLPHHHTFVQLCRVCTASSNP